jgi:hypothetical protein
MTAALRLIPAQTVLQMIEGAGHDLMKGAFPLHEKVVLAFVQLVTPS